MGTDIAENVETSRPSCDLKVHRLMCTELNKLVERVSEIFPEIEAARPRCSLGIETLCLLTSAIDKSRSLLQHCSESCRLYLALTGDVILSRCKKSRNLLAQSLSQIQNMVPVPLAAKITLVISDLRRARFSLDPSEAEAGKVVRELLHQYASASASDEDFAFRSIQAAALRLHITSQTAILIEKRSIKKSLDKLGESEPPKRKILLFFYNLLKKYGKLIVEEQKKNGPIQPEDQFSYSNSSIRLPEAESYEEHGHFVTLSQSAPLDEFRCPLSLKLMHDPVVVASGQTYERMWIQRWFDEGHDTCPKTKVKLAHLSMTPNATMKDLISKWCSAHRVTIPDPRIQAIIHPLESSNSIASLTSSLNDLFLPGDFSNVSLGSLDNGPISEATLSSAAYASNKMSTTGNDGIVRSHSGEAAHEKDIEYLTKLDSLPWESQFHVVKSFKRFCEYDDQDWEFIPYQDLIQPLIRFLKHAHDLDDVKAQRTGCIVLLAIINKCRTCISYINDDAYGLLGLFIDTEVTKEALSILEALSCDERARKRIASCGVPVRILKIFDSETKEFHEPVLSMLCNLSEDTEVSSLLASFNTIPILVPFLEDVGLAKYCVTILKNMSHKEHARVSIAETDGCIASLVKLLESGSHEDQEHAVAILLSLCSERIQYCQLVMDECVIPGLVDVSINGSAKAKSMAMELLRLLRNEFNDSRETSASGLDASEASRNGNTSEERKSSSKASRIFGKISMFSKTSSLTTRRRG